MSALQVFHFTSDESETGIRTATDEAGNAWFVLADLLKAIGTSTTTTVAVESIIQGLGDGYNKVIAIADSLGRQQSVIIVSEAAATYLLSRSNTEGGRKLNRYLHAVVLPEIRKTGGYAKVGDPVERAAALVPPLMRAAEAFGFSGNQAALSANRLIARYTGINLLEGMGHGALRASEQEALLTPSDIALRLGISKTSVNPLLIERGLQTASRDHKNRLVYEPTEAGREFAVLLDTGKSHRSGTPVRQLKWKSSVLQKLGS